MGAWHGDELRLGECYSLSPMSELCLTVNGKSQTAPAGTTVAGLLEIMGVDPARVAVERNLDIVPRQTWRESTLAEGDKLEIVAFIGGGSDAPVAAEDPLVIAGRTFRSRLLIGTGKYKSVEE